MQEMLAQMQAQMKMKSDEWEPVHMIEAPPQTHTLTWSFTHPHGHPHGIITPLLSLRNSIHPLTVLEFSSDVFILYQSCLESHTLILVIWTELLYNNLPAGTE